MRIGKVVARNFQSYKEIEFDYSNLGLTLVSGPTGSGKSTLMDAPAWILFGVTSKDGNADDVRSWFAEEPTFGQAEIVDAGITVTRIRGKASQNDLYYIENTAPDQPVRGKDITETQKKIEARLSINADMFFISSYMHQFSKADSFFIAKAKERREVLEKIADLSLPVKLAEGASEERKVAKKELDSLNEQAAKLSGKISALENMLESNQSSLEEWNTCLEEKLAMLKEKSETFEEEKQAEVYKIVAQLEELDKITVSPKEFDKKDLQIRQQLAALNSVRREYETVSSKLMEAKSKHSSMVRDRDRLTSLKGATCPTCLGPTNNANRSSHIAEVEAAIKDSALELESLQRIVAKLQESLSCEETLKRAWDKCREEKLTNDRLIDKFEALQAKAIALRSALNNYQQQIDELLKQKNPFIAKVEEIKENLKEAHAYLKLRQEAMALMEKKIAALSWLYDKSFELRGVLLERSVKQVNDLTNAYLEKYFDARLRINLVLKDSDKLEVEISNDGYPCPFKQLSGGERCMLKLAFSVSVMECAQNACSIKFYMLMLDEALNGLDDSLKVKAFTLLQQLENNYESVLVIDHSTELKQNFQNVFNIIKDGNYSRIDKNHEQN